MVTRGGSGAPRNHGINRCVGETGIKTSPGQYVPGGGPFFRLVLVCLGAAAAASTLTVSY